MKSIASILLLVTALSMRSQTATINLNNTAQTIRGFGGINHPEWYSDLNAAERQLAFGNGPGQLGFTVLRTYVSDNSSNFGRGIETAKYAYNSGALVFASPWNPPAGQFITVNGVKRINPATFAQYADHLNSYVTFMKNNGVNLYAISTQNEPDYAHDWTEWSPQESVNFIKGYANRINCRLMTPESFQYRKSVYDPILNDPAALANVDIFGTHLYGTPYSSFPYPLFQQKGAGKELWMTEVYTDSKYDGNLWNDALINQDQHALKVAEHIHYAMVDGNFQTYVFWPIRRYYALIHDGNADGQGNTPAAAGTATKRGYCMAQFSKWVRPGFVRVEATKSPTTNVFVSAYKKDHDVVIVVVNKNTSTRNLTLSVPGTQVSSWEQYTTSASKNLGKGNNINSGASFQVTLDAASVTTFVGKATSGMPTVSITAPANNTLYTAPAAVIISATASDANGSIAKVEFFNGTTKIGEDLTAPYSYSWDNVAAGSYSITARATDNSGNMASATAVGIKVNVPQGPYNGKMHLIPGTIQAEDFDLGGNGQAYMDDTPGTEANPVANYRTDEDVDIEICTDTDGGYNVGHAKAGEWLEYTTLVQSEGLYDVELRVACNGTGRRVSLALNQAALNDIAIPNTGGWQAWQTITVKNVALKAGQQILRLAIGTTDYVNINYIKFNSLVTGIAEDSKLERHLFPNPFSSGGLQIAHQGDFQYKISDVRGAVLEEGKGHRDTVVGMHVPSGVYTLTIIDGAGVSNHKIVKK